MITLNTWISSVHLYKASIPAKAKIDFYFQVIVLRLKFSGNGGNGLMSIAVINL